MAIHPPERHRSTPSIGMSHLLRLARALTTNARSNRSSENRFDVVIHGGGVVGLALALALRANHATESIAIAIVDRASIALETDVARALANDDEEKLKTKKKSSRVVALTPRSIAFLDRVGAWESMKNHVRAFDAMQVWDGVGGGHVRYDAKECAVERLGAIVEVDVLRAALEREIARQSGRVRRFAESEGELRAAGDCATSEGALRRTVVRRVRTTDGDSERARGGEEVELEARLVVAADGPKSATRRGAKIRAFGWGYGQRAACGIVRTTRAHSTAWQRFLPTGPIALLPMGDGTYSNVVWTTTPEEARRLTEEVTAEEFAREVDDALQGRGKYASKYQENLNRFAALRAVEDAADMAFKPFARAVRTTLSRAAGVPPLPEDGDEALEFAPRFTYPPDVTSAGEDSERASFPLSMHHALELTKPRLALIGDAAHVVHPLGGQGLNLGLRDAELLADALSAACELGQDIGSVNALKPYARASVAANVPMMAALDGLQKLFSVDAYPVAFARSIGLATINATGPLRRQIAFYAMGGA